MVRTTPVKCLDCILQGCDSIELTKSVYKQKYKHLYQSIYNHLFGFLVVPPTVGISIPHFTMITHTQTHNVKTMPATPMQLVTI